MFLKKLVRNNRITGDLYIKLGTIYNSYRAKCFPKEYSQKLYMDNIKRPYNNENPTSFTEKLMFLKLNKYWNNPLIAMCADKYRVRDFVRKKGAEELLTKLYGTWERASDIEWDKLPDKFVIKCNHGSGYNIVCKDIHSFDKKRATSLIDHWMKERYGLRAAEQGIYDLIERKIIAEEYIETNNNLPPADYKFFCSFGEVKLIFKATDRIDEQTKFDYYYPDWTYIPVRNVLPNSGPSEKPDNLEEMLRYASLLSKDFPIVRVDFYNENNRIIFGELTFTHFGCINGFDPDKYDYEFGALFPNVDKLNDWDVM